MTLKSGAWVDPSAMLKSIRDAGFKPVPEDVRLSATGALELRHGRIVLALSGMTAPRDIPCVAAQGPEAPPWEGRLDRSVLVGGRWRFEDGGFLEVEAVEPAPASP